MIDIVTGPRWFNAYEVTIDIIGAVVIFLISYFSSRYYALNKKNKNYAYLSAAFFLLGLSFLSKIIVSVLIYFVGIQALPERVLMVTQLRIWSSEAPYTLAVMGYRFLTICGLYVLYRLSEKNFKLSSQDNILIVVMFGIIVYFTQNLYYVFHILALLLLFMITNNYIKVYYKNKSANTKSLAYCFGLLGLSHLLLFFSRIEFKLYVIGGLMQLLAYVIMLITFIMVLKHGKKTK